MKVQVVSDIHMEFGIASEYYDKMVNTEADILLIAGDLSNGHYIAEHLNKIQMDSDKIVVFVPGNHDYYHSSRKTTDMELDVVQDINKRVFVLNERCICLGGIIFLGSTGWWDGSNGHIGLTVRNALNDFRMIYDLMDEENDNGIKWGIRSKEFFVKNLSLFSEDDKVVCVSHHYPHMKSLDPRFNGSPMNACFGNRWEHIIEEYQPDYWIHGHTHTSFDYNVGNTRVICNPQGYPLNRVYEKQNYSGPALENNHYDPQFVIEI